MSAPSTLVFYGLRVTVDESEIESLEMRSHPLVVKARENRLKSYWGRFGIGDNRYFLFIGDLWGSIGAEGHADVEISLGDAVTRATDTDSALMRAGFDGSPALYIVWQADD